MTLPVDYEGTEHFALHPRAISARWALACILGLQAVVSLRLHNSAFQDEGLYLYAGRQIVHHLLGGPAPLDHYAYYFSGYPYVYPLIGGFLDTIGGLALARDFSLACMLGVTTLLYVLTTSLFELPVALFATAIYASAGVVMFVGRLATFDALCLLLIALSATLALRPGKDGRGVTALALGPALALAILAKYAALLFVLPVLGLLACRRREGATPRSTAVRVLQGVATFAASLGMAYVLMDKAAFHAIAGSTTNRVTGLQAPRISLALEVLRMGGAVYGLALAGLALILLQRRSVAVCAVLLFLASLLTPAYHIYKREPISLDKHIAYGLYFAAPLAGYAVAWVSGYVPRRDSARHRAYWLAGIAVVLVVFTLGLRQSHHLYDNWANTSDLSYALHTQLRNGSGRVFAEDIEVARYDARDVTQEWQWSSFYYPYYVDAHHHLFGDAALIQAVNDRYYDFVELSFNYFPAKAYFLAQHMADTRNYDLIGAMPLVNSYGRGHFFLWRSALVAGHGNFTTVAQVTTKRWFKCTARICQP